MRTPRGGTGGVIGPGPCPVVGGVLRLPATYRDFDATHPDFELAAVGLDEATLGLVDAGLGPDGVPTLVATSALISSPETFAEWYRDVPGTNATIAGQLALFDDGLGGYVNRWGSNGESWLGYGERRVLR